MSTDNTDLLIALDELQKNINYYLGEPTSPDESIIHRYRHFIETSERGTQCHYAAKCKDLFLKFEYERVRDHVLSVLEILRTIEGREFGSDQSVKETKE